MPDVGRPQDSDLERRGAGVHRHRAARRLESHRRRACHPRVLRHGPQRDGLPRERGLPGPAAHVGRSHPDRQGVPVLRRPPQRARPARHGDDQTGRGVLLRRPRSARGDAPPDVEPARVVDQQRRCGRRTSGRSGAGASRAVRRAVVDIGDRGGGVRERQRRERVGRPHRCRRRSQAQRRRRAPVGGTRRSRARRRHRRVAHR